VEGATLCGANVKGALLGDAEGDSLGEKLGDLEGIVCGGSGATGRLLGVKIGGTVGGDKGLLVGFVVPTVTGDLVLTLKSCNNQRFHNSAYTSLDISSSYDDEGIF
jgi:hypothetical protein